MKKWKFIGGLLIGLIALTLTSVGCKDMPWHEQNNYDTAVEDSVCVAHLVEDYLNPQFASANDVLEFRAEMVEEKAIDSIFLTIPENVLNGVASVLIKKYGIADKKQLVEEYNKHADIYNNLPQDANKEIDLGATDLGNKSESENVISTSFQYRTDTIDGKPVYIQIKTEESYVDN